MITRHAQLFTRLGLAALLLAATVEGVGGVGGCNKTESPKPPPEAKGLPNIPILKIATDGLVLSSIPSANRARLSTSAVLDIDALKTPVLFGSFSPDPNSRNPVVARKLGNDWRVLEFTGDLFNHRDWTHVSFVETRNEILGLLDSPDETPLPSVVIVRSADEGLTWATIAVLAKPHPSARFDHFGMSADGKGRLTLFLENSENGPVGFYHYRTTDGGNTWFPPEFEPDSLLDADLKLEPLDRTIDSLQPKDPE